MNNQRWKDGGWDTLEEAMAAYRRVIDKTLGVRLPLYGLPKPLPPNSLLIVEDKYEEFLYWLAKGAPWYDKIHTFAVEGDGRGNHRFVAVGKDGKNYRFSTHAALHGDFTEPKHPFIPDNPFEGLRS